MKIQCDVCSKEEAAVFCTADEAALCDTCDHGVHHANKLASKHQRFSLLHPSSKNFLVCDICQEKRAFLFCQQDRAVLCRGCDASIHSVNEHTQKHNRFLLTGVKLSATSALYVSSSSPSVPNGGDLVPDSKFQQHQQLCIKKPVSISGTINNNNSPFVGSGSTTNIIATKSGDNLVASEGVVSTSSISEYLMETLPGWHVEDFLDSPPASFSFCKTDDGILPLLEAEIESNTSSLSTENLGIWVPHASNLPYRSQHDLLMGGQSGFKDTKEATSVRTNDRRWADDVFTVPQISPPYTVSKRPRPFW